MHQEGLNSTAIFAVEDKRFLSVIQTKFFLRLSLLLDELAKFNLK